MSKSKKVVQIVYATDSTPAMSMTGESDKERLHLSPAEFSAEVKALANEAKDLVKMARKVGALKVGNYIEVDGAKFGAKELNKLVATHVKRLRQLKKNYSARGQKKKRATSSAPRKAGEGFDKGSFLEAPLVNFLRGANFAAYNTQVHAAIDPLLDQGVLSRGIITPLITTYMFVNGLRFEEGGNIFFRTNAEMNAALGPYISSEETSDSGFNKKGNPRMKFNRNKFIYNRLQSIVNPGIRAKGSLGEAELEYLENAAVKKALADAFSTISAINSTVNPK